MRIHVVTIFPELLEPFLRTSLVGRAVETGRLAVELHDLRPFGIGRHRKLDDTPYGGGSGMLMRVDCLVDCLEAIDSASASEKRSRRVLLTPQGARLDQRRLIALAAEPLLTVVCGRYEGFDERIRSFVDEEISLGDFVMAGGEVAAMAVIEGVARLLPGVLGNALSTTEESHSPGNSGLLEYPQYTRPVEYRGTSVPGVLLGGNHARIASWRAEQAEARTKARRPDLMATTTDQDSLRPAVSAAAPPSGPSSDEPEGGP
jgi:tRNA (guanine37-N1)-methyltransferase